MFSRRGTLAVVCLATAMLMLDIAVVNTALPKIASSLDAGISGLQWVVDAYTVALAAVVLTSGSIADRFGRRRLFVIGLVVFTGASLWCGAAGSIAMLDAARAVQGLGAAILFATSLALLADAFPDWKERSKALAIYGATIGASFAVGPAVGGAMTSYLGWRWVFYVNVPVGIATIAATYRWVRESRDPNARRVDWPGQTALVAGLFLLVLGLLRGNQVGWGSAQIVAELGGAVLLLAAFLAIETRVKEPMLPLGLFRNKEFAGAQIAVFSISASFFAIFLYTTLYLQQILDLSPIQAGLVYLPATMLIFVVSGMSASLLEKVSAGALIAFGLGVRDDRAGARPARDGDVVVVAAHAVAARRRPRHRPLQPGRRSGCARVRPAGAERPRRGRERHVPPGRDRGRRRALRRADPGRRGASARARPSPSSAGCTPP